MSTYKCVRTHARTFIELINLIWHKMTLKQNLILVDILFDCYLYLTQTSDTSLTFIVSFYLCTLYNRWFRPLTLSDFSIFFSGCYFWHLFLEQMHICINTVQQQQNVSRVKIPERSIKIFVASCHMSSCTHTHVSL